MNNTEFTMPDPGVFGIQPEDQHSVLLYQQALKSHNEARTLHETLLGLQAQLGDARAQLLQAGDERLEQNKLLREAMGALRDAASECRPSLGGSGEVKVNTKQPQVAAPRTFNVDSEQVDQFLADCWLNFNGNTAYAMDSTKITFALSYMKDGSTSQWANNVMLAMQAQDATRSYSTWADFRLAVLEVFKGGAQVEIAQAKMEKLRQGKSTATEYFTVLDSLNKTAAYDEVTLI
jgi:hypothetical protein